MQTKSFEMMIHSQYAFDFCRKEVYGYEDCRQTSNPLPKDPALCRPESKTLVKCYNEAEKMDPMCLDIFNDSRECLFKSDGNLLDCKPFLNQYVLCQKDPEDYKLFLNDSTTAQKKMIQFDFRKYRGNYNKYN